MISKQHPADVSPGAPDLWDRNAAEKIVKVLVNYGSSQQSAVSRQPQSQRGRPDGY